MTTYSDALAAMNAALVDNRNTRIKPAELARLVTALTDTIQSEAETLQTALSVLTADADTSLDTLAEIGTRLQSVESALASIPALTPGGADGAVQVKSGTGFAGAAKLTYDTSGDRLVYAKQTGDLLRATGFTTAGSFGIAVSEYDAPAAIGGKAADCYLGYNILASGGRVDTTKAAISLSFTTNHHAHEESPGVFRRAANLAYGVITIQGTPRPLFSAEIPETDLANGSKSQGYLAINTWDFRTWDQSYSLLSLSCNAKTLVIGNGAVLQKLTNAAVMFQQMNAAGTGTVNLPYIGNFDQLIMPTGLQANGAHINYGGNVVFWSVLPSGASNGAKGISLEAGGSVTGYYSPFWIAATASTRVENYIRNWHATGQAAFVADAYGGGDSVYKAYADYQGTQWTWGIDASVTGRPWVLAKASTLGTAATDYLTVTGGGGLVVGPQVALATNATDGFLYVPTSAGAPTGVPAAYTGKAAFEIDTTNGKLKAYYGGAWYEVPLTLS